MSNQFLNAQEYANVMLLLLKNQLVTGRLVDGQFKDQVTDENGLSINIKRPPQFIAKSGAALAAQDLVTGSVNVAVNQYKNVHISIGDLEYVQSYNELMKSETMKSAASRLAHDIDSFLQSKILRFNSWVGDPGQDINSPQEFNAVHTRLMEQGVPNVDLGATVTFGDGEKIRGSLIGGDIQGVNRNALEKVRIPILSEIDLYATQQGPTLTTGTRVSSSAGQVNGGTQNVNYRDVKDSGTQTLILENFAAAATMKAGEVFTIANVYAYDNRAQQALPYLQQFTLVSDATADGSGDVTVTISPAIIVPGTNDGTSTDANTAFATVDSIPANDATLVWKGDPSSNYKQRAAWHKRAIALVSARLHMPFTGEASFAMDPETGVAIRYWRGSDINTGAHVHRWDMIYGAETVDPRLGARVNGVTPS